MTRQKRILVLSLFLILLTLSCFHTLRASAVVWIPDKKTLRAQAEQGFPLYQGTLGGYCYRGVDPCSPKNYQEAAKWWRLAAEQGDIGSQQNLGMLYCNGDGVNQDFEEAYFWLELASKSDKHDLYGGSFFQKKKEEAAKHLTEGQKKRIQKRIDAWRPTPSPGVIAFEHEKKNFRIKCNLAALLPPALICAPLWLLLRKKEWHILVKTGLYATSGFISFVLSLAILAVRDNPNWLKAFSIILSKI